MNNLVTRGLAAVSLSLGLVGAGVAAEQAPDAPKANPVGTCAAMMPEGSPEGQRTMREFMQSDRGRQAMANMMEMARRMGNGDVMVGMTRMMEMMGSKGERMGGQGGMMQPGSAHPDK